MAINVSSEKKHNWKFKKLGGFYQVCLETGDDIRNIPNLDQKNWAALNCPVNGIEFDKNVLTLLDSDNDGNIRVNDIISAVKWICNILKNPAVIINNKGSLDLSDFNQDSEDGKKLYLTAARIIENSETQDKSAITINAAADAMRLFDKLKFNGDGLINSDSSDNPEIKKIIEEIIKFCGCEIDKSGNPGVSMNILNEFFVQLELYLSWRDELDRKFALFPYLENILNITELFNSLKPKIDDYFIRCNLIEFDKNSETHINSAEKIYSEFANKQLNFNCPEIEDLPIAIPNAGKTLNLKSGINPLWINKLAELYKTVITPLLGEITELTGEHWQSLKNKFSILDEILKSKPKPEILELDIKHAREIYNNNRNYKDEIIKLIEKDKEYEPQAAAIIDLNKLLIFSRHLYQLLNNFVSFANFYNTELKAVFQSGTLYIDGRCCELCVTVEDAAKHSLLAGLSRVYLLYCDCVRRGETAEKITIAAAVTAGDAGQLMVGRNGVYYDRAGRDWNATIVKIIENPISIRQAFWSPYKAVAKMVSNQIQKFAAS